MLSETTVSDMFLNRVAVLWDGISWEAFNVGTTGPRNWSTKLGNATAEEIYVLFRHAEIIFLPSLMVIPE